MNKNDIVFPGTTGWKQPSQTNKQISVKIRENKAQSNAQLRVSHRKGKKKLA